MKRQVPPHVYALLRIAFGLLGLVHLVAMSDISAYWAPDGLVPAGNHPALSAWLQSIGYGYLFGAGLWIAEFVCFAAMTVGLKTQVAVAASFFACLLQARWNPLPLSSAFQLYVDVLFCLLWANGGKVWSVDAWRSGAPAPGDEALWPLRLIRFQVALLYFTSALWKVRDPVWRTGTALHYFLSSPVYARFPSGPPLSLEPLLSAMTYAVLAWEFAFAFLLLNRHTRTFALATGVVVHLGMWFLLELGPFTLVVLASYIAFVDPWELASRSRSS